MATTIWACFIHYGELRFGELQVAKETPSLWKLVPDQDTNLTGYSSQIRKTDTRYQPTRKDAIRMMKLRIKSAQDSATEALADSLQLEADFKEIEKGLPF